MPLLGRDHLSRGQGEVKMFNRLFYTFSIVTVLALSAALLFTELGPKMAAKVFGPDAVELSEPLGTARPLQSGLLLGGILLYEAKVLYWYWVYNHSNTITVATVLLVGYAYYYFMILSIILPVYLVDRMPSDIEIALALLVGPLSLFHELMADREMALFKSSQRKKGELLDYGYHSACRHPNYFFNSFPIGCIGLMSGSRHVANMWVCIQVFWAYQQSGPGLEEYMAKNYGEKWKKYCNTVPFFVPSFQSLKDILLFKYI